MTKAFSIISTIKASGLRRQPASLGIKTYNTHREQQFYGSEAQVAAVLQACAAAGYEPEKIPNTWETQRVRFEDGKYLTAHGGYVTYLTPKAYKLSDRPY